jgi:hypothetical protein
VIDLADLDRLASQHRTVLKDEPATTVERLGTGPDAVVRKIYRCRGLRWLQTFGRRSRAEREFDNLRAVAATGAACTEALGWSAERRFLCVSASTLVTRFVADSVPLKHVLGQLARDRDAAARRTLATAMGRLVARLHRGGFLWCTPMPRNVLVVGAPGRADLAVCDTPAGIPFGRSIHGTFLATIDLYDAAFSPSRCRDFSRTERLSWLRGYCGEDRAQVRALWSTLTHRRVFVHDAIRALAMAWHTYILQPLRRRRAAPPRPAP